MWTSPEYALNWPADLLRTELLSLRDDRYRPGSAGDIERLLAEAFHTEYPAVDFAHVAGPGEWTEDYGPARGWLAELLAHIGELRPYVAPRYWNSRQSAAEQPPAPTLTMAMEAFADVVRELHGRGYLDRDFSTACLYGDPDDHGRDLNAELYQHLADGERPYRIWPLRPDNWDAGTFWTLVEVFHDLVARPRRSWGIPPDHEGCDPHFIDFDAPAGRRVYRALVNRVLAEHRTELRLAETGEDTGRLVQFVDDARTELVERALWTPETATRNEVAHAVALFRGRSAGVEQKRSAIVALAGVLEARRELLKTELVSKDEGALFDIANNFDLRHRKANQQGDYDPVFLDWIFWWYLATVELTNRLISRQATS